MISRRHHYISQFYLKGFGRRNKKKKSITVIDLKNKVKFSTISKNIANIRDFNLINIDGMAPDAFETILSNLESEAAEAIQNIHITKEFEGKDRLLVLELIANFAARNPTTRKNIAGILCDVNKRTLHILLKKDNNLRKALINAIKITKPELEESEITEEHITYFISNDLTLKVDTTYHLYTESIMIETLFTLLTLRKWTLIQSSEKGPFITSNNPVILCWDNPDIVPKMHQNNPGFGLQNTVIYFPLSQNLALIGEFKGLNTTIPINKNLVAIVNTAHLYFTNNQIYTPSLDFFWLNKELRLQEGKDYLKILNIK